jgi:outer membrane receptor protein involved in Fe transport
MYFLAGRMAVLAVLLSVTSASAAQTPQERLLELTLEELLNVPVVTVTRTSEGAAGAPGRVDVVTAAQIQRRGYRSLADLLRDVPGIETDLAIDQDVYSDVTIQGARGGSRLVILLDGVRISSPTNEPLPILANFPVHSARQVEVVYGPASALYGADAFSGVINIISRDADEADGLRAATQIGLGHLSSSEASYGVKLGTGGRLLVSGQWLYDGGFDLSAEYPEDFGDMASHRTGTFNTIFGPMQAAVPVSPAYSLPLRAGSFHALAEAGPWTASVFASTARTSNTPAYTPDNAVYNDIAFAQNEMLVGTVSYRATIGRVSTTTSITGSRHELDPESGYLNVFSNLQRSYKYAYGSMLRAEHQASWKASPTLSLTAGGAYERLFAMPQSADLNAPIANRGEAGTILGTSIVDELFQIHSTNVGAYLQAQWSRSPKLAVTAGGRVDYSTRHDAVFNPRVGLVSRIASGTTAKLLYGTAFLAPSPYQSYAHYGSFYSLDGGATYQSDFWHVPSPDLKPQRKRTVEVQIQQALGANLTVGVSGFHSWLTDLVLESDVTARTSGTYLGWPVAYLQSSVNGGRERMYGGTLSLEHLMVFGPDRRLHVRGALSLVDGRVSMPEAPGGEMESGAFAPELFQLVADIDWGAWSFAPRLVSTGEQRGLAPAVAADGHWMRQSIDGFMSVDLTARRRRVLGPVDLFLTVENLFDARYRHLNLRAFSNPEEMEGSPQNPRRISIGAQIRIP